MSDLAYRSVAVCVVWISLGTFLAFGVPAVKPYGAGGDQVLEFDLLATVMALLTGIVVTLVIWLTRRKPEIAGRGFEVVSPVPVSEVK
jgi:hypothetical protein